MYRQANPAARSASGMYMQPRPLQVDADAGGDERGDHEGRLDDGHADVAARPR